ncbi:ABC transporter ATP-binding protein [Hydrogenophaga sp. YM1]|uniref:ABC transporter ATP-binding protein n=1 Tax=Hydrogenophaga sp. YM1 TaxID=2806262 RepID=UPI00195CFF1D|nr:ABC transporter ATP-binding protein [Hydrogenophaga sp. YM1]QRR33981.1 ABC transporter ATP-binding protein [Hydrogenophaga sp. YM1]
MTVLLDVKGLQASYASSRVLHGLDFALQERSITALLGSNGAGKTTTLRALCRMKVETQGSVTLAGRRIDALDTAAIVREGVGHVPDGRGTFLELSVADNLRLGAYVRRDGAGVAGDIERIYGYFPRLRERSGQQAGTLSGGEQQMLAIGRALMSRPRLLLLDEPSFGLAPIIVAEIFDILRKINEADGMTILLVEQNAALGLSVSSFAYVLESGRIVLSGAAKDIQGDATVRRAYLGG